MKKIFIVLLLCVMNVHAAKIKNATKKNIQVDQISYINDKNETNFVDYDYEIEPGETWELRGLNAVSITWCQTNPNEPGASNYEVKEFKELNDSAFINFNFELSWHYKHQ